MADATNAILPKWDTGEPIKLGTTVYNANGSSGTITEITPGRLKPIPGPYGGSYPPRVSMKFEGGYPAGVSMDLFDNTLESGWRVNKKGSATGSTLSSKDLPPPSFLMQRVGPLPIFGWLGLSGLTVLITVLAKRK